MALQKLVREKRYLYVLEQIVATIKDDGYNVGDKLSTERVIAEKTGVSRSSVREALAVLEMSGVIDVRVGDGIYVKGTSYRDLGIPSSVKSPFDVIELRMCLESKVVVLAAERRSKKNLKRLQNIIDRMQEITEEAQIKREADVDSYTSLDQNFHNTIASCTENEVIKQQTEVLVAHLFQPIWLALLKVYLSGEELGGIQDSFNEHKRIFNAIERQDPHEAEEAMWDHLLRVRKRFIGEI